MPSHHDNTMIVSTNMGLYVHQGPSERFMAAVCASARQQKKHAGKQPVRNGGIHGGPLTSKFRVAWEMLLDQIKRWQL